MTPKLLEIGKLLITKNIQIRKGHQQYGRRYLTIWWNYNPFLKIYLWKIKD